MHSKCRHVTFQLHFGDCFHQIILSFVSLVQLLVGVIVGQYSIAGNGNATKPHLNGPPNPLSQLNCKQMSAGILVCVPKELGGP
ncbi:uncharacterized protein K460DRAFT_57786 [Cucurbitaria berberidis CBS 394.84]|uniref:Uncharacterized protein n=1 Tax=Cucurbitaria berberidis CBS 394.84 TaxID=1168544 RepID=A0A9P4LAE8_9PLEO|nr:uncharacterized protein K460DRAFT_57786 [Cucurbitaria berberidis CBS 394.84]KAF1847403.1 hypothetical protein K460DRAFT_57786 [Cucurbitaria berberidis CBS 394.84]